MLLFFLTPSFCLSVQDLVFVLMHRCLATIGWRVGNIFQLHHSPDVGLGTLLRLTLTYFFGQSQLRQAGVFKHICSIRSLEPESGFCKHQRKKGNLFGLHSKSCLCR